MIVKNLALGLIAGALCATPMAAFARTVVGSDREACVADQGSAIEVNISGLKDRTGRLKLELYPATKADFLADDHNLEREGKTFRRVWADTPASGAVAMCIKTPGPGTYALFFTHDRDGKNKFNIWRDGAGVPSNERLGRSKPAVDQAVVRVGEGVTHVDITAQYLRSIFSGFGPLKK